MFKSTLTLLLVIILIISCQEQEDSPLSFEDLQIQKTQIINNNEYGVTVRTQLIPVVDILEYDILEHGFIWTQNQTKIGEVNLGLLKNNSFETTINTQLVKNNLYKVYPYIKHEDGIVYGEEIEFNSLVEVVVSISEIVPLHGFVGDTISIKGANFCQSINGTNGFNQFKFGDISNIIISESDTIIKAVIGQNIHDSKPNISIRTCGVVLNYDEPFSIDPPVIDSISSGEFYPSDNIIIYGKNFLSRNSKVWIGGIEVVKDYSYNTDELSVYIPKKLSTGKLDVKIQVLDQSVIAKEIYQSTTPYIEVFTPTETGFLDTITIQGKYLFQKGLAPEVKVGYTEEPYFIENDNKDELKVVLSNSFSIRDPMLSLEAGEFVLKTPLNMTPPIIVSLDKKIYHLNEDIEIVSKNFIDNQWFIIGNKKSGIYTPYTYDNGIIKINMGKYLGETSHAEYTITNGEMEVQLSNSYGKSIKKFRVHPPVITSIDKSSYHKGEYIEIRGNNFGSKPSSKVYIDDIAVGYNHSTSHLVGNQSAKVQISGLNSGMHKVKIITGGQESNEVEFEIKEVKVSNLSPNEGHRETLFTIEGENLGNYSSYSILIDGVSCYKINDQTDNKVQFYLPTKVALEEGYGEITIVHENEIIKVGTIKVINEPYKYIEEYNGNNYSFDSSNLKYFDYDNTTYSLRCFGQFQRFNFEINNWESLPNSNVPSDICNSGRRDDIYDIIVLGDVAYKYINSNFCYTYNFKTNTWESKNIQLENGETMIALYGKTNEHTLIIGLQSGGMYNYNINTGKLEEKLADLPDFSFHYCHYKDDNIVLSDGESEVHIYDIPSDSWKDISYDYPALYNGQNIYIYNNVLYRSGGYDAHGNLNYLYAYDIKTGIWKRKLPSVAAHLYHIVFGHEDKLYFVFGHSYWNWTLNKLLSYDIKKEPF